MPLSFESIVHHLGRSLVARKTADGVVRRNGKAGVLENASSCDCAEIGSIGRRISIEDLPSIKGARMNAAALEIGPLRPGALTKIADTDLVFER